MAKSFDLIRQDYAKRRRIMRITHLMLACFYMDNYSYQENLLPKYHKELGYDVHIIASTETFNARGVSSTYRGKMDYTNEYGIPVRRLYYKKPEKLFSKLRLYQDTVNAIDSTSPDVVFLHGCQFLDALSVVKYAKSHRNIKIYVDNHADKNNSASNWASMHILHKLLWRYCAQKIEPYTNKFYGVLPARVEFLKEIYSLPADKCMLLILGADDEEVQKALNPAVREKKRKEYAIAKEQKCVLTGGKIDHNKPQVIDLMKAVNKIADKNIQLFVFGSVAPELGDLFESQLSEVVHYIGWKESSKIYEEYAAADIVAFPGLHSVLWEQAVGMGKPCIFKRIQGFEHIDLGGNCLFFEEDTIDCYCKTIQDAINQLPELTKNAEEKGIPYFSYREIAKKSIGDYQS